VNLFAALLLLGCLAVTLLTVMMGAGFVATRKRIGTLAPLESVDLLASDDRLLPVNRLCVVIPARNEAADIATTVRSLLAQRHVDLTVIVVNDHSTDGTAEILDRLVAEDTRVSLIHDPPLRAGWFGKANAMQHGLEGSSGELVLFTDADIAFHPLCLSTALAEFHRLQLDFLSLLPRFDCSVFWENVYMPHSFIAGCVRFLTPGVNQQHSSDGAAAGAFMLAKRSMLNEIGGLASVKQEMLDDVCLARKVKREGFRGELRFAPELLSVQMFKSNKHAFWGTTKNILAAVDRLWKAVPVMFLPVVVYGFPVVSMVYGLSTRSWLLLLAGSLTYGIQVGAIFLVQPISRLRWPAPLCFPLAAIPIICCMSLALYQRLIHRSVLWRGRQLQLDGE
jgi:chlorobactene glucosyltransferase